MQKLFNADLLDIVPVEKGFIYACKETLPDGSEAAAFYSYNQQVDIFEKIPDRFSNLSGACLLTVIF